MTTPPLNPVARYFLSLARPPKLPSSPRRFIEEDLRGARFVDSDLSGSRFQEVSFQYARLHGVDLTNAHIWGGTTGLVINGIEIEPLIEAELERRYPGRATLFAADPDGVRTAWDTIENLWSATVARAQQLPEADLHQRVNEEWSFLETVRHLVECDDGFLRQVRDRGRPFYAFSPRTPDRGRLASEIDTDAGPESEQVLSDRAGRLAEIRDFISKIDTNELSRICTRGARDYAGFDMPVLHCVWRLVNEEWEHHTFAVRDLASLESSGQ